MNQNIIETKALESNLASQIQYFSILVVAKAHAIFDYSIFSTTKLVIRSKWQQLIWMKQPLWHLYIYNHIQFQATTAFLNADPIKETFSLLHSWILLETWLRLSSIFMILCLILKCIYCQLFYIIAWFSFIWDSTSQCLWQCATISMQ